MAFDRTIETFIKDYSKEIEEDNAAIFAGAGLSVGAGYVDWKALLKPVADELGLDVDREHDLVAVAQYHANETGNRSKINRLLLNEFANTAELTENHKLLSRLPISVFWTTNYDKVLQTALEAENKKPDVKYTIAHLTQTQPGRDAIIYKMHGDVDHPSDAVLTKDDYESYHKDRDLYLTALAGDLVSKTFLFLGFSFTDPNLDYILSRVRVSVRQQDLRQHYALLRKINRDDFENDAEYEYNERRQELFVHDLKRFGIQALLLDSYSDITEILNRLYTIHRSKSVMISGAAHEYGRWTPISAEVLVRRISANLIEKGCKIVSGFGLGIGSAVIAGALDRLYAGSDGAIGDKLILRPFPQGEQNRPKYTEYRKDIVSLAGVAIFLFGNKLDADGQLVNSPGVEEEFNLAVEAGLFVVPIGSTGYMSQQLWKKVADDFENYYPDHPHLKETFDKLGNSTSVSDDSIVDAVMQILGDLMKVA